MGQTAHNVPDLCLYEKRDSTALISLQWKALKLKSSHFLIYGRKEGKPTGRSLGKMFYPETCGRRVFAQKGTGTSLGIMCPTAICVRWKMVTFLPIWLTFLSQSMSESISVSLSVFFCLYFSHYLSFLFPILLLVLFSFLFSVVICFLYQTILCLIPVSPSKYVPANTPLDMRH